MGSLCQGGRHAESLTGEFLSFTGPVGKIYNDRFALPDFPLLHFRQPERRIQQETGMTVIYPIRVECIAGSTGTIIHW